MPASGEEPKRRRKKGKKGGMTAEEAMNAFIREQFSKADKRQAELQAQ